MANNAFTNRVFGAVILKSINSNFNADFTHHPRTLPDGVVYSTDKALKYAIKDYFRKLYKGDENGNSEDNKEKNKEILLFYVKRFNENIRPLTLDETYHNLFGDYPNEDDEIVRLTILRNLLSCLDIRLFGATFAGETNISIHGPVQINHGVNCFPENDIYTEDILSPFRRQEEEGKSERGMSTIGNQTNLKEGHYVFHLSVNPGNTEEYYEMINEKQDYSEKLCLTQDDIEILKDGLNNAVTALDSTRKIGTENEATIWIQLKENSRKMFPSITELIDVNKSNGMVEIDCSRVKENIEYINQDVEKVEIYYNPSLAVIKNLERGDKVKHYNIITNLEIIN